jgi:uncharacterized phosphosugar-binding protein
MHHHTILWVLIISLTACGRAGGEEVANGTGGARAYYDWVMQTVDALEADLAQISDAGTMAAKAFVDGRNIGVRGGRGLDTELNERAGGLLAYRGEPGEAGDIIIYAFGVQSAEDGDVAMLLQRELADAQALRSGGSVVIGIGSLKQLQAHGVAEQAAQICTIFLDNHAPGSDGLLIDSEQRAIIPTFTTANAIVLWSWCTEFFSACTRLGHTLPMYASYLVPGGRERAAKYRGQRFQQDMQLEPIESGLLGQRYLDGIRQLFAKIGAESWQPLLDAAEHVTETLSGDGKVFITAFGHYSKYHTGGQLAGDPSLFERLNLKDKTQPIDIDADDYVIAIGYSWPPGSKLWTQPKVMRQAGGVAWVITDYETKPQDVQPGETLINQHWELGDALVEVPGYDIRICPPSGVTSEALMWMLTAAVYDNLAAKRVATPSR